MKLVLVSVLLLICLLAGCAGNEVDTGAAMLEIEPTPGNLLPTITPVESATPDTFSISPAIIQAKALPDSRLNGGYINIENHYSDTILVSVYHEKYGGQSYSKNTDEYYMPPPDGYADNIGIDHWGDYNVPASSILTLPVEIFIPADVADYPEKWEFHIVAAWLHGNIREIRPQRWFITMR